MVKGEYGDARSDEEDDQIFVYRVRSAENREVKGHDGQEFAGFSEYEGDVVDVTEGRVAERRGQRGGDGDEKEWNEDGSGGEDVWN